MKKLALLAVVLLTTSCAVSEESSSEPGGAEQSAPQATENQSSSQDDDGISLDPPDVDSLDESGEPSITLDVPSIDSSTDSNQSTDENSDSDNPEDNQDQSPSENESSSDGNADPVDTSPPSGETVNSYIDLLRVAPEVTSGYDRDLFKHWVDDNGNGCHAREETLIAESVGSVNVTGDCEISGSWFSAFDGETTTNPSNFDVDHLVPLKEAWDSGANRWNSATRERFANDLGSPHSLIAVSRGSNRSKGARDPAEWMPPRESYHCEYVYTWTLVKIRWDLTADRDEIRALRNYGGDCLVSEMNFSSTVTEAEIVEGNPPEPEPEPEPAPSNDADGDLDPRFNFCTEAKAAGYGPYVEGVDPEYDWYTDGDSDGTVCE